MGSGGIHADNAEPEELAREFERRVMQLESTVRRAHEDLFERLREQETELDLREERIETLAEELEAVEERVRRLEAELEILGVEE